MSRFTFDHPARRVGRWVGAGFVVVMATLLASKAISARRAPQPELALVLMQCEREVALIVVDSHYNVGVKSISPSDQQRILQFMSHMARGDDRKLAITIPCTEVST